MNEPGTANAVCRALFSVFDGRFAPQASESALFRSLSSRRTRRRLRQRLAHDTTRCVVAPSDFAGAGPGASSALCGSLSKEFVHASIVIVPVRKAPPARALH